jgi:glutamyl-tRNA reductase
MAPYGFACRCMPTDEEFLPLSHLPVHPDGAPTIPGAELARLVVASATFRDLDTKRREALAATLDGHIPGTAERVLLHTCHRVELIALVEPGNGLSTVPGDFQRAWGLAAAERVMLIAGGLDSAVVAEEQVLGQIRDAYASALDGGQTGPITNELLRRSIRFGRRVRSFAQPSGDRSLVDLALRWVEDRVPSPSRWPRTALVIGTGKVGRELASRLAARGAAVTVASRNAERAATVMAELPHRERHRALSISDALVGPVPHNLVAFAIHGGAGRLEARHLLRPRPLVVDLSAPSVVAADAAMRLGDRLLDLDRLGVPSDGRLTADAEHRLREEARNEASAFAAWLELRAGGDGVALLRGHAEEIRTRHLDRLRHKGKLDEGQAAAVEAMTTAMFGELLHGPTIRLGREPDAAARVREIFGLD